jgi:hypothetical protein
MTPSAKKPFSVSIKECLCNRTVPSARAITRCRCLRVPKLCLLRATLSTLCRSSALSFELLRACVVCKLCGAFDVFHVLCPSSVNNLCCDRDDYYTSSDDKLGDCKCDMLWYMSMSSINGHQFWYNLLK